MKEPLYRWVCPMCGISDAAESPEMARLNIDVHLQVAHPSARKAVRVRLDPDRDVVVLDGEAASDPAEDEGDRGADA